MKLSLLLLVFTVQILQAQFIKPIDDEYTIINISIDPYASIQDKGINIITDVTLVSYFGYVKAGVQLFSTLVGGYYDIHGGIGLNQKSALFGIDTRIYEGIKGGLIYRGESNEYGKGVTYPLFGIDIGFDLNITDKSSIGLKSTLDYREDFKYSGAIPKYVPSGFIVYTYKL